MQDTILDVSWFMKYQPKKISDYVFENDNTKMLVQSWIEQGYINGNILLCGPAGVGKTALSELLISNLIKSKSDLKRIRSRSVNEIDDLFSWVQKSPIKSKKKIIYLEEFDKLSAQAQTSLKDTLLEKFQNSVSFIATTNYINKVDKALVSRFNYRFELVGNNIDGTIEKLKNILKQENVEFNEESLKNFVQNNHKQGLRNLITNIQINSFNNIIDFNNIQTEISTIEMKIVDLTCKIIKTILSLNNIQQKKQILVNPLNSVISQQYAELMEILQFQKDIHYESIYLLLNENVAFLPIKALISKYLETLDYKKLPYLHYLAFFYEMVKIILDISIY